MKNHCRETPRCRPNDLLLKSLWKPSQIDVPESQKCIPTNIATLSTYGSPDTSGHPYFMICHFGAVFETLHFRPTVTQISFIGTRVVAIALEYFAAGHWITKSSNQTYGFPNSNDVSFVEKALPGQIGLSPG